MWYPDNQLKKKLNLCMLLPANKNIFARIKKEYKICISNLTMKNYIYLRGGSRVSPLMQMTKSYFLPMKCQAS